MRILVLTADYPKLDGTHERMFVHVRNLYYKSKGIDVVVLNFASDVNYDIDGIKVISLKTYKKSQTKFNIVVSHASNLRNQYIFLTKYEKNFETIVFFFHGHEVLYRNKSYPKPYDYMRKNALIDGIGQDVYDWLKIRLWRRYFTKNSFKSHFVFVSNWILTRFKENTGLSEKDLKGHVYIINNSIGSAFETGIWDYSAEKKYDFITIRSNIDGSKYGVDLVMKIAEKNSEAKFLLIGRGKYFDYHHKPDNVEWINRSMDHKEMFSYLDASRCALLLTREDTQGVMTCELAAYGMPVITSDIEVCHEFFEDMPNVQMIDNENPDIDILLVCKTLELDIPYPKYDRYFCANTTEHEVELYQSLMKEDKD